MIAARAARWAAERFRYRRRAARRRAAWNAAAVRQLIRPSGARSARSYLDEDRRRGAVRCRAGCGARRFYTYRHLGNIVEDLSVDGGSNYFIANPASIRIRPSSCGWSKRRQAADAVAQNPGSDALKTAAAFAQDRLNVYKAAVLFPNQSANTMPVTLTANKRFSNRFSLIASYTYSRLGNYPGLFSPYVNQLDPNISSQYDIIDLTANRNGPLNNDRPHNFKLTGYYAQPIASIGGTVTVSLTFSAISGRPIQVLGAHIVAYGGRQTLILPSGSGGRTPTITQLDLHLGYDQKLGHKAGDKNAAAARLSPVCGCDKRPEPAAKVTNIDEEYTFSIVNPILGGRPSDLKLLRTNDALRSSSTATTASLPPVSRRCSCAWADACLSSAHRRMRRHNQGPLRLVRGDREKNRATARCGSMM